MDKNQPVKTPELLSEPDMPVFWLVRVVLAVVVPMAILIYAFRQAWPVYMDYAVPHGPKGSGPNAGPGLGVVFIAAIAVVPFVFFQITCYVTVPLRAIRVALVPWTRWYYVLLAGIWNLVLVVLANAAGHVLVWSIILWLSSGP